MADNRTALDKQYSEQEKAARLSGVSGALASGGNGIDMVDAEFIPISPNELSNIQKSSETDKTQPKHDDPVGIGMAAIARPLGRLKYYIGKFRWDAMRWKDGRWHFTSLGFIKWAKDELFDGDGKPVPMGAFYVTPDDEVSNDDAEQPVFIWSRSGIRCLVPLHVEAGIFGGSVPAPSSGGRAFDIWAPDGLSVTQQNMGGNFVTYILERPWDKGKFKATFSSDTGVIPRDQQRWEGV